MTTINGFSRYLIYENGDIYSKCYKKFMKTHLDRNGYFQTVLLNDDNKRKNMKVHRLVALAYIPNHDNKPCVDHIDQNKTNNHVSNLRWATNSENQQNIKQCRCNNKLGEKYISINTKPEGNKYYRFQKTNDGVKHIKHFKTLEEAKAYKDSILNQ